MSAETEAERLGCDPREIVSWPWTTASPGHYVRVETAERIVEQARDNAPATLPRMAKPSMEVNISFRVRRELRDAAREKAEERQENVSDVLREALERYVRLK